MYLYDASIRDPFHRAAQGFGNETQGQHGPAVQDDRLDICVGRVDGVLNPLIFAAGFPIQSSSFVNPIVTVTFLLTGSQLVTAPSGYATKRAGIIVRPLRETGLTSIILE